MLGITSVFIFLSTSLFLSPSLKIVSLSVKHHIDNYFFSTSKMLSYCFLSSIITTETSVIRLIIFFSNLSFFLWSLLDILFLLLFWNLLNLVGVFHHFWKMPTYYFPFEYCISSILPFWKLEDVYFRSSQFILPHLYKSLTFSSSLFACDYLWLLF